MKPPTPNRLTYIAEYLPNIKAISISIQLEQGLSATKLEFPTVKTAVLHYGYYDDPDSDQQVYKQDILLPQDIKASLVSITIDNRSSQLSFRLPASPDLNVTAQQPFSDNSYPWSASDLTRAATNTTAGTTNGSNTDTINIGCRWCQQPLVRPGQIKTWKPLPSEHWAELMDYWHCHKPDIVDEHGNRVSQDQQPQKDYTKALIPSEHTCLVGTSCFTFNGSSSVVQNVTESPVDDDEEQKLSFSALAIIRCCQCNNSMGIRDPMNIIKFYKWNVVMLGSPLNLTAQYDDQIFISSLITEKIDAHSIYSYYLQDEDDKNEKSNEVLIKVFNPRVTYTFTGCHSKKDGVKIFFSVDRNLFPQLMQTTGGDVEIVSLPIHVLKSVKNTLLQINKRYPDNAQKFGLWLSGILELYSSN